jgi:hypothetical protein
VLYTRELPGGGYVVIEAAPEDGASAEGPPPVRGVLWVERRADPARRSGHRPPVVVEATGPSRDLVLDALRPSASDNVEVARAIRRWQLGRMKG